MWWAAWKARASSRQAISGQESEWSKPGPFWTAIGIGGDRVQMYNLASSEAPRFVEIAEEMTRKILALGPNPIKTARKKMAA